MIVLWRQTARLKREEAEWHTQKIAELHASCFPEPILGQDCQERLSQKEPNVIQQVSSSAFLHPKGMGNPLVLVIADSINSLSISDQCNNIFSHKLLPGSAPDSS